VGCKIATVLNNKRISIFPLSGKSAQDWDLAAPELILTEAGGQFTHFDGSLLKYNQGSESNGAACLPAMVTVAWNFVPKEKNFGGTGSRKN